jgi:thiamine pyrophosphokinase
MKAVVVASGDVEPGDLRLVDGADLVVAADGGVEALVAAGQRADLLIGDLDSTDPALVERVAGDGTRVQRHPADKEASDTELAVRAAAGAGASELVLLGATGGDRLDHELANVLLLGDPLLAGIDARIVRGDSTLRVLRGGEMLVPAVPVGGLVTLLAVGGDARGVTTAGLRWPLAAATLAAGGSRGLSNEVIEMPASVRLEHGMLLVVETAIEGAHAS